MAKKKASVAKTESKADPALSKHQKFQFARILRSQINSAPYNPREIDPYARKKLKQNIGAGKIGLLEALVWNKRTGILVGGHQRLDVLDELEGYAGPSAVQGIQFGETADYLLDVCQVDLDDKTEREQNVALNNPSIAGAYRIDLLDELIRETPDFSIEYAGFDHVELEEMYNYGGLDTGILEKLYYPEAIDNQQQAADEINSLTQSGNGEQDSQPEDTRISELKARKQAWQKATEQENEVDYFLMVVFKSDAEKFAFCNAIRHNPTSSYIAGGKLVEIMGLELKDVHVSKDFRK